MDNEKQCFRKENLKTLSDKDLLFLIESFSTKRNDYSNIADLVRGDEDVINHMIDSDRVFDKVMASKEQFLEISPYFLFSLLLRKAFREKRENQKFIDMAIDLLNASEPLIPWNENRLLDLLDDPHISNYIANMLSQFTRSSSLFKIRENDKKSCHYIVDMIEDSIQSDNIRKYYIYCHIGDYTLFLTGMIPEYIDYRFEHKKRPVDRNYYVKFGKVYYGLASGTVNAKKNKLSDTLSQLSEGFEVVVKILHYMNNKYFSHNKTKLI